MRELTPKEWAVIFARQTIDPITAGNRVISALVGYTTKTLWRKGDAKQVGNALEGYILYKKGAYRCLTPRKKP